MRNYQWTDGFNCFVLYENVPTGITIIRNKNAVAKSDLFYTGVNYDHCCFIEVNGVIVGIVYISMKANNSLYIEWIEIFTPFRGKGILKQIFKGLIKCYRVNFIRLESEEMYFKKYLSVGCQHIGMDENTELGIFEYQNFGED